MYWIYKAGSSNQPDYHFFMCDTADDIDKLPTQKKKGIIQDNDWVTAKETASGSKAFCIANSKTYRLSMDTDKWIEVAEGSGSGGGSSSEYIPVRIKSFLSNAKYAEIGSTVSEIEFSWELSGNPSLITLNGNKINSDATSTILSGLNVSENAEFTLYVEDLYGYTDSETVETEFVNAVYYGATETVTTYDSSFINKLTKSLQETNDITFTVDADENDYIYYALSSRYGTPTFSVNGFIGGINRVATIQFTNSSGYEEAYNIYRSDYMNLGQTTVTVS